MYEAYHIGLLITSIMCTIYVFVQVVNGFDKLRPARSNSISCSARYSPECAVVFNETDPMVPVMLTFGSEMS